MGKAKTDGPLVECWEADADGRRVGPLAGWPAELPHALAPGTLFPLDDNRWTVLAGMDNRLDTAARRWRVSLTAVRLPDPLSLEDDVDALRRQSLRACGWIA